MKIQKSSGPQRCMLCLKDRNEAIQEHLRTNKPCCPQCPLGGIIRDALQGRINYGGNIYQGKKSTDNDVASIIIDLVVWVVVGLIVYYITRSVLDWDQYLSILASVFWPVTLTIAFYYYLFRFIIGLF